MMDLLLLDRRIPISLLIVAIFPLSAAVLGFAVAYRNYNIIFLIGSAFMLFTILKSNVVPIVAILLTVSSFEWASDLELIPPQIMWVPELLSGLIFVKAVVNRLLLGKRINLLGIWIVLPFLGVTSASLLYNGTGIIPALLFLRLLFRYYLLFIAILNLEIDEKSMKSINNVIVSILVIQLFLSFIKLFMFGQGEMPLGLNSHSLPTVVPLVVIGFALSYYLLHRRSILYVLLALGFIGFSIIGGKRAFPFFLPIVLAYLAWFLRNEVENILRYLVLGILVLSLSTYFAFRLIPTLNPQRQVWGKFDLAHVANYVYKYNRAEHPATGLSHNRISTTTSVFKQLCNRGPLGFLVGFGPGVIVESIFEMFDNKGIRASRFGIGYGITGLTWLALQVGCLGAFTYILLFCLILKRSVYYFGREIDSYWRSFALGMIGFSFTVLLINLSYVAVFYEDNLSSFYFCLAGFIVRKIKIHRNGESASYDEYEI